MTLAEQMLQKLSKIICHLWEAETLAEEMKPPRESVELQAAQMSTRCLIHYIKEAMEALEDDIKSCMPEGE